MRETLTAGCPFHFPQSLHRFPSLRQLFPHACTTKNVSQATICYPNQPQTNRHSRCSINHLPYRLSTILLPLSTDDYYRSIPGRQLTCLFSLCCVASFLPFLHFHCTYLPYPTWPFLPASPFPHSPRLLPAPAPPATAHHLSPVTLQNRFDTYLLTAPKKKSLPQRSKATICHFWSPFAIV